MRRTFILTFALLLQVLPNAFAQIQEPTDLQEISETNKKDEFRSRQFLNLTVGIDEDVKLPPLPKNVDFGGTFREFVKASISRELNVLRFSPKKEGATVLTVIDQKTKKVVAEYNITIKKSRLDGVANEMRALLGDIEGINIKVVNNRVVVDGQVLLPKDMSRVYGVVSQFGDQAASLVSLSPLALKKITEYISRDINNPEIEVRAVNEKIILQGFANSADEKDRAEIIAKTYLPDMIMDPAEEKGIVKKRKAANDGVINLISVKEAATPPPPKMVQLVVRFVELKKDYGKNFRFEWRPGISDGTRMDFSTGESGTSLVTAITGTIDSLLPKLTWLKQHGFGRVLESTSLIVQDGKKGELSQTTNQPYPVIGAEGTQGTAFAKVGINTGITPTILGDKSGSIHLAMNFSISSMAGRGPAGAPITSENNISTEITVRDRQSAAVGGLVRNSSTTGFNKDPGGSANPLISLYASKDFQRDQSQFVVFVTPVIKTSASQGSEQIKKKFRLRE
jgi:pilus assembly protein CpaC